MFPNDLKTLLQLQWGKILFSWVETYNEEGLDNYNQEISTFVFVCVKIYLTM